jgi:hypothetical protein
VKLGGIRLVPVVDWLYLNLDHAISAFYLPLDHQRSSSLQHLAHSYISISHVSILSPSQHHHFILNHFIIYFVDEPADLGLQFGWCLTASHQ